MNKTLKEKAIDGIECFGEEVIKRKKKEVKMTIGLFILSLIPLLLFQIIFFWNRINFLRFTTIYYSILCLIFSYFLLKLIKKGVVK